MAHIPVPEDTDRRTQYSVVGSTSGPFAFDFVVFDVTTDLRVFITSSLGIVTELLYASGFTVIGNTTYTGGFDGGNVTLVVPVANSIVTIWGEGPYKRTDDLSVSGPLDIATLNSTLDRMAVLAQQLKSIFRRSPVLHPATLLSLIDIVLPPPVAGKFIRWNLGANNLETTDAPIGAMGLTGPSGTDDGNPNVIVNADSSVAQMGNGNVNNNDNAYANDGLRILSEANGDTAWSWNSPSFFSGFFAADQFQIQTANQKFGQLRVVEQHDCYHLFPNGTQVIASAWLGTQAGTSNVKMAILAYTGTANATGGDPISVWNGDNVNPTLAANWFYCNAPVNLNVPHAGLTRFSVVGTVPSSAKNLALFIWNDGKTTTGGEAVWMAGYQLQAGATLLPFQQPIDAVRNLARCQRYLPAFDATGGANAIEAPGYANSSTTFRVTLPLLVATRIACTGVTVSNPTNFRILRQAAGAVAVTALSFAAAGPDHITLTGTVAAGLTAGEGVTLQSNNVNCRIEGTGARL